MLPIVLGLLIVSRRLVWGTRWVIVRGTTLSTVPRLVAGETILLLFYRIIVGFLQPCRAGVELG